MKSRVHAGIMSRLDIDKCWTSDMRFYVIYVGATKVMM